ncbi:DUF2065 domain-containing protein [Coralloluteibacterium thermophilus]|uniref:DUF2065 domain-containing protein n=1 Tax=Coralloluteibacterium thermophilum TaxID=2707049 RepID=A0ABV9NKF0_9GAMM
MGANLWAALCLVLVLEGLMLFAVPRTWKRAAFSMLRMPDRALRVAGALAIGLGLVLLQAVR